MAALLLLPGCAPGGAKPRPVPGPTGIAGEVRDTRGESVANARVYAYRSARTGLRGPADFEALTDSEGRYFLDLVEGDYHLAARKRRDGGDTGPPRSGDAWAIYPRNPVRVIPDHTSSASILIQSLSGSRVLRSGSLTSGDTGFTGRIVDAAGVSVAGAFALGYRDEDRRRPPDFNAPVTSDDGRFTLYLSEAGRYCLAARLSTRGQPGPGEPYGIPEGGRRGCFAVEPGRILDIGTIVLTPFGSR